MFQVSRHLLFGYFLVCIAGWGLLGMQALRFVDQGLYDLQARWLRKSAPTPLSQDIVVIGFDEAAYESIPEPSSLWHRHLGSLLSGLAAARPAVVGLATPLPVRSYDFLVRGIDAELIAGIERMRGVAPLVIGLPPGIGGKLRPIAPTLVAAIGQESIASLAVCEDSDGVVRRLNQKRCRTTDQREPLALAMARHMGRQGSISGMIDFTVGSDIEYTPALTVLGWIRGGDETKLRALVQGRAVVVANLLPTETRYHLPVPLAAWDLANRSDPGAVVHIQALRSLLARGLIERAPEPLVLFIAGIGTLFWFGSNWRRKGLLLLAFVGVLVAGSTFALWHGNYLRVANTVILALMAFAARQAWDFTRDFRQRQSLRSMFAGHVSPAALRAILGGELAVDQNGQQRQVTILYAGIRGFSARSASATPEAMIGLLNRFLAAASMAIQGSGGAVDKFIGDGLLATFGLPQPLPAPSRNALEAAQHLLLCVDRLNAELSAEGIEPLRIGIGIHSGEVLCGFVGSAQRRDFTVIGDTVGLAGKLEALSKEYPHPVICSHDVAAAVGFAGGLVDLGAPTDGSPHLWGWTPPLTAPRGEKQ